MMHGFGMSFGFWWMIVPIVVLIIGGRLLRRLIGRRDSDRRIVQDRSGAPESIADATIFRLAKRLNGRLTVSDVVIETGMKPSDAEHALQAMTDGLRVRMEVSSDGLVIYEFAELRPPEPSA